MLREALEDALARGEKLRREITKEILNSQVFSDLANNPRFVKAVARVIRSKDEVGHSMQKRVREMLQVMHIPTREQVRDFERRVARLEKDLDQVSRRLLRRSMQRRGAGGVSPNGGAEASPADRLAPRKNPEA